LPTNRERIAALIVLAQHKGHRGTGKAENIFTMLCLSLQNSVRPIISLFLYIFWGLFFCNNFSQYPDIDMAMNRPRSSYLDPCPLFLHPYGDLLLLLPTDRERESPLNSLWIGVRVFEDAGPDRAGPAPVQEYA
jgi:hypothetical protein